VRPGLRSLTELSAGLDAGELTSRELTEDCLARVAELDPLLHAFLHVDDRGARRAAAEADERRRTGQSLGPLDGIPYALKDNIVTRGMPTTCASRILEGFRSPYDATIVERLRESGAILLGKTNLDEFAMGSSTEHSAFGPSRNPHDPERVPGGSSGGSCVAVAAGMVPLAFGSDTGGSVRLPASFCGVVGLKPTYGRISRHGLVAFASSLDQIGPIARTVSGCALSLEAVSGSDDCDATSHPGAPGDFRSSLERGVEGMRIGVVREHLQDGSDAVVRATIEAAAATFEGMGAKLVEVSMPHAKYGVAAYYVIASAEASSNLARFDGARYGRCAEGVADLEELYTKSRSEGFGEEVKRRIMIGTFTLSSGYYEAYYARAMRARSLIHDDYERAFEIADVLASPVSPVLPFSFGARLEDPLAMYLTDVLTVPANLAGVPALSLPCGATEEGLPIGLQLQAPYLEERRLFAAAHAFEKRSGGASVPRLVEGSASRTAPAMPRSVRP
jgi:aspartyl-tRNA(Asn)/glutamyl-tRNA(Gln) amidotransferase subunit A